MIRTLFVSSLLACSVVTGLSQFKNPTPRPGEHKTEIPLIANHQEETIHPPIAKAIDHQIPNQNVHDLDESKGHENMNETENANEPGKNQHQESDDNKEGKEPMGKWMFSQVNEYHGNKKISTNVPKQNPLQSINGEENWGNHNGVKASNFQEKYTQSGNKNWSPNKSNANNNQGETSWKPGPNPWIKNDRDSEFESSNWGSRISKQGEEEDYYESNRNDETYKNDYPRYIDSYKGYTRRSDYEDNSRNQNSFEWQENESDDEPQRRRKEGKHQIESGYDEDYIPKDTHQSKMKQIYYDQIQYEDGKSQDGRQINQWKDQPTINFEDNDYLDYTQRQEEKKIYFDNKDEVNYSFQPRNYNRNIDDEEQESFGWRRKFQTQKQDHSGYEDVRSVKSPGGRQMYQRKYQPRRDFEYNNNLDYTRRREEKKRYFDNEDDDHYSSQPRNNNRKKADEADEDDDNYKNEYFGWRNVFQSQRQDGGGYDDDKLQGGRWRNEGKHQPSRDYTQSNGKKERYFDDDDDDVKVSQPGRRRNEWKPESMRGLQYGSSKQQTSSREGKKISFGDERSEDSDYYSVLKSPRSSKSIGRKGKAPQTGEDNVLDTYSSRKKMKTQYRQFSLEKRPEQKLTKGNQYSTKKQSINTPNRQQLAMNEKGDFGKSLSYRIVPFLRPNFGFQSGKLAIGNKMSTDRFNEQNNLAKFKHGQLAPFFFDDRKSSNFFNSPNQWGHVFERVKPWDHFSRFSPNDDNDNENAYDQINPGENSFESKFHFQPHQFIFHLLDENVIKPEEEIPRPFPSTLKQHVGKKPIRVTIHTKTMTLPYHHIIEWPATNPFNGMGKPNTPTKPVNQWNEDDHQDDMEQETGEENGTESEEEELDDENFEDTF